MSTLLFIDSPDFGEGCLSAVRHGKLGKEAAYPPSPQDLPCAPLAVVLLLSFGAQRARWDRSIIRYMIIDNAIYVDGRRAAEPSSLQETYQACREQHGLAWKGLYETT